MSDAERTAIHEAGHAVITHIYSFHGGRPIGTISILSDDLSEGRVLLGDQPSFDESDDKKIAQLLVMNMVSDLAGIAAERIAHGDFDKSSVRSDYRSAREAAALLRNTDEEIEILLTDCRKEAERMLKRHWRALQVLADYLVMNKECDPSTAASIIEYSPYGGVTNDQ